MSTTDTQAAQVAPAHTPGPWKSRNYKTNEGGVWIDCDSWRNRKTASCRGGTLALALPGGVGKEGDIWANARLIAAAPDLLAACESALWLIIELDASGSAQAEVKDQLRAAIAKATGGAE